MGASNKRAFLFAVLAVSIVMALMASVAAADDFQCPPTTTGVILGNLIVPPNETCVVEFATVRGNVRALEGSRLFLGLFSTVEGNVEGIKPAVVQVTNSTVWGNVHIQEALGDEVFIAATVVFSTVLGGNIHIQKGRLPNGDWTVLGSTVVKGNIQIEENASERGGSVIFNQVAGNVQIVKNVGSGPKFVLENFIAENLQCFENEEPFEGAPNVARQAQGQCSAIPPTSAPLKAADWFLKATD